MTKLTKLLIFLKNNSFKKKKVIIFFNNKIYQILKNLKQDLNIIELYYIKNFLIIYFNYTIKKLKILPKIKITIKNFYKFFFIKKQLYFISTNKGLMSILKSYQLNLKGPLICIFYLNKY